MNEYTTPITDTKIIDIKYGYIAYLYKDIFFKIAKLTYNLFENESFQYIFEPFYDVIDAFESLDIPGLDLSLREPVYYRVNITPSFISERVIPKNRVNLIEELNSNHLDYYQPMMMLLDSNKVYGGDHLSVKSDLFFQNIINNTAETSDLYKTIAYTLRKLSARADFKIGNLPVDHSNRTILIKNYLVLYEKVSAYYNEKSMTSSGRKKQIVSYVVLEEIQKQYTHGLISIDEAIKKSGLGSKRTFYRRIKELSDKKSGS
jgi:hypothetical protein